MMKTTIYDTITNDDVKTLLNNIVSTNTRNKEKTRLLSKKETDKILNCNDDYTKLFNNLNKSGFKIVWKFRNKPYRIKNLNLRAIAEALNNTDKGVYYSRIRMKDYYKAKFKGILK